MKYIAAVILSLSLVFCATSVPQEEVLPAPVTLDPVIPKCEQNTPPDCDVPAEPEEIHAVQPEAVEG